MVPYHPCLNTTCVGVDLGDLDKEVSGVIGVAWAQNTKATGHSQWKKYLSFYADNELVAVPADPHTVARFLVYLSRTTKYRTVNNYLSAINKLHEYYGYTMNFRDIFLFKLVLSGLKRQLGDVVTQNIPLSTPQLLDTYKLLDMWDNQDHVMWCAIVLSFGSLLAKSNVVPTQPSM